MHDDLFTWTQKREALLELWVDEHLASLSSLQLCDLEDPAVLRAIATRANELARITEKLAALRGSDGEVNGLVDAFREQLADI
jgi:hypothetical protein